MQIGSKDPQRRKIERKKVRKKGGGRKGKTIFQLRKAYPRMRVKRLWRAERMLGVRPEKRRAWGTGKLELAERNSGCWPGVSFEKK